MADFSVQLGHEVDGYRNNTVTPHLRPTVTMTLQPGSGLLA